MPIASPISPLLKRFILCGAQLFFCWSVLAADPEDPAGRPAANPQKVALIQFEGMIHPLSEHYFYRQLDKAKSLGVDVVVVEIDSPGGFVDSSVNLAARLRDVSWAKTVAYIPREALSGAAIMALGCDEIIMHPQARIGDAGPIFQGEDALFRHAPEKIRSDLVRQVRDLATHHSRPPALAEAMVDMDIVVYQVKNRDTGEITYKSDPEIESLADPDVWEKGPPVQESRKGLFLELNGQCAAELNFAEGNAGSRRELAARFGVQPGELLTLETTWIDTTVMLLNSWPVTVLLLIVGLIALYIELSAPGTGVGGLIAGLCFALFFWSRFLGGTSGWLEVVLFLGGVVFLLVELFVIPGFGFAGFTGGLLIIASLLMASQQFTPNDGLSLGKLSQSLMVLTGSGCAAIVAMFALSKYFGSIPVLSRLALQPPAAESLAVTSTAETGSAEFGGVRIGDVGVADSPLRPAGRAMFADHYLDVVTDGSFVDEGQRIRVIKISGNRVMVRQVT